VPVDWATLKAAEAARRKAADPEARAVLNALINKILNPYSPSGDVVVVRARLRGRRLTVVAVVKGQRKTYTFVV
jgi:hypothetical protein